MGKYEDALKDYNKALELDPKRINTYNNVKKELAFD